MTSTTRVAVAATLMLALGALNGCSTPAVADPLELTYYYLPG